MAQTHFIDSTRRRFTLAGASWLLVSCGAKPILAPKPKVLTVDLLAAANLNPSASGRPSPVVVILHRVPQTLFINSTRRRFTLASSSWLLVSCGAKPILAPKPKVLTVDLLAAANLNPSASGRPSPVVVRVYELKAAAPFEAADFISLFDKDQAVLGGDVVARDEFVLSPGEAMAIKRDLHADSKFIAVMAAFRDLERAKWRAVVPLLAGKDNALSVRLEASAIQLGKR